MQALPVRRHPLRQGSIGGGQDLGRQQAGIGAIADGHRGHGNARRHLHDRMQRIHTGERAGLHRHTNHRQRGEGGHHAGQVSGTAGAGDDHLEAAAGGLLGEGHHLQWSAVGREHPHLGNHPEALQHLHRRLHGGQIGVAAHHHGHERG